MSDSSDFTFCQVGLHTNDAQFGPPETVPNISKITLDNGVNANKLNSAFQGNSSRDGEKKDSKFGGSSYNKDGDLVSVKSNIVENTEDTPKWVQEVKPTVKKLTARAKVPFEKGYSQMDWLKLTRTHLDLAGLKGLSNRRLISINEVKQHKTESSAWTVLKGCVYNISPYMKFHPGGEDMLMKAAGKDCTALFNKYHAWVNAEFLLEKCLVGVLDERS